MKTFTLQHIHIRCIPHDAVIVAACHGCGLAYHPCVEDASTFTVTHLASGKRLIESALPTEKQARKWIQLLKDACDWWYLEIDPALEAVIDQTYRKARKQ